MSTRLVLFDDRTARDWRPFTLTRPAGELLFGAARLIQRAERAFGLKAFGHRTADHLTDFEEPGAAPVLDADALSAETATIHWSSRAVPEPEFRIPVPDRPTRFEMEGQTVGYYAPSGRVPDEFPNDGPGAAADPRVQVPGRILVSIWELMLESPDQARRDLRAGHDDRGPEPGIPQGVHALGTERLELGTDVEIEPTVVLDLRDGPIRLGNGVQVRAGTRLAGPAVVGDHSRLLGGVFEKIVTGPYCYLRGEISHTTILGYCNKAHDGYLGHAYLGCWVNLGAFTTNSDLKNNYHPVRVWTPTGMQDTGELKVGCFLGDHVKTGIGLLFNTGTVVEAGSNLYGTSMPPQHVPPFQWGEGTQLTAHRREAFLDTAERAMARRGVEMTEKMRRYLNRCWEEGSG